MAAANSTPRRLALFPLHPAAHQQEPELGPTRGKLRVTLSYFVEPNPGERGWRDRYRYASHGLRFEVKGPTETIDEIRKRTNKGLLAKGEQKPTFRDAEWFLGEKPRDAGSLHSDFLETTAANLADRSVIGVYPVGGWWKDSFKRGQRNRGTRYTLTVSIDTTAPNVDLWTPVAAQIGVPIEIEEKVLVET